MPDEFKNRVLSLLRDLDIEYRWEDHEAVFTVAESMGHLEEKRPTKNLVLQDKSGRTIMVVMDGLTRLDTKQIARELETKKLNFAKPDVLMDVLGVTPGSCSVFGLLHEGARNLEVVLDSNIICDDEVGFHPNDNTSSIFFEGNELPRIIEATGHTPKILDLAEDLTKSE